MITLNIVSCLINGLTSLLLAIFVFIKNPKHPVNYRYALFGLSVALWGIAYFLWHFSTTKIQGFLLVRILLLGAVFIPSTFFHFACVFLGIQDRYKKLINIFYTCSLIFSILNFTPYFVKDLSTKLAFKFWPTPGVAFHPFLLFFIFGIFYTDYVLWKAMKESSFIIRKLQIRYILLGTFIGALGGSTNYFLYYDVHIPPVGNILSSAYVILTAYAMIRYRLMDIRVAITRFGIFTIVYAAVLGIPFGLVGLGRPWLISTFGQGWFWLPMFTLLGLATSGPFIYTRLRRQAENRLLAEEHRGRELLSQAAKGMTRERDLKKLQGLIVHITPKALRLINAAIYLFDKDTKQYTLQAVRLKSMFHNAVSSLTQDNPLIQRLAQNDKPLVYEEVRLQSQTQNIDTAKNKNNHLADISSQMKALSAAVIVPASIGNTLLGFLVLGDKKNGRAYSEEDISVLETLADQAALAIENAQFYKQEAERKALLYQSAILSDLGVMADSMGHQIKNHLQKMMALAGSQAGILEELLEHDMPHDKAKQLLKRTIEVLSEVTNQGYIGAASIEAIRKFSHLSREEFKHLKIQDALNMAKDVLRFKVRFDEFDYIENIPEGLPSIYGHPILTEAFLNLINNGYDAINEKGEALDLEAKRKGISSPPYRGKIIFQAVLKDQNTIEVKIQDNGIGIKKENLKHLFFPFYTTKATSDKKGTGLGLYVIKNIVDTHKGKITVESEHMKGTTFTILLPIKPGG